MLCPFVVAAAWSQWRWSTLSCCPVYCWNDFIQFRLSFCCLWTFRNHFHRSTSGPTFECHGERIGRLIRNQTSLPSEECSCKNYKSDFCLRESSAQPSQLLMRCLSVCTGQSRHYEKALYSAFDKSQIFRFNALWSICLLCLFCSKPSRSSRHLNARFSGK